MASNLSSRSWEINAISSYYYLGLLLFLLVITTRPFAWSSLDSLFEHESQGVSDLFGSYNVTPAARSPSANIQRLEKRLDTATWNTKRNRGNDLNCLMQATTTAAQRIAGRNLESTITLTDLWEAEGWQPATDAGIPYYKTYLDTAFADLGVDGSNPVRVGYIHTEPGFYLDLNDDDAEVIYYVYATGSVFYQSFIPSSGAIIADKNVNPENTDDMRALGIKPTPQNPMPDVFTQIRKWSDAAFLEWKEACQKTNTDIMNVQYIFRAWVTNQATQAIVFEAFRRTNTATIGKWPDRKKFTLADNPDELYAILASPNGAGCAHLLITHKGALGIKYISSVTVWVPNVPYTIPSTDGGSDLLKMNLMFKVEPVPNPTQ